MFKEWAKENREQLESLVPDGVNKKRCIEMTMLGVASNPSLLKCSKDSIVNAIHQALGLGLEVGGPLQEAWLTPRGSEAKLSLGYRGLLMLAKRSGELRAVHCEVVREGDNFERTATSLVHEWNPFSTDRGGVIGVYCIMDLCASSDSVMTYKQYECMDIAELRKISALSRGYKSSYSPWRQFPEEMMRKTVLRRAIKKIQISAEAKDAIGQDDEANYPFSDNKPAVKTGTELLKTMVDPEVREQ